MICRRSSETTPLSSDQDFFFTGGGDLARRHPHWGLEAALLVIGWTRGALQIEQRLGTVVAAAVDAVLAVLVTIDWMNGK